MSSVINLYAILRVPPGSDLRAIRTAYRREARRHHPDAGGDERYMIALNKAWSVLQDPARRAAYDKRLYGSTVRSSSEPVSSRSRPVATVEPVGRASGTVLDFGRYVGWTIGQLAAHDPDYLLWLERTPIGRPLRPEIQTFLGERRR
ncbi:MAG: molecular chaperone DnaJ [Chloroflexota bacterium]|jgi:curved DNA-binding protein CbpA|nr:molecular chaperone DnaJ [Chloroflexota bacterium]